MSTTVYGWSDDQRKGLNEALFVTLKPMKIVGSDFGLPQDLKDVVVIGKLISDDTSLSVNWENKFDGDNVESSIPTLSAIMQSGLAGDSVFTGKTAINVVNTLQIFKGIEAQTFTISLEFVAFSNAELEVELPLQALLKMMSPQLSKNVATGTLDAIKDFFKDGSTNGTSILGKVPFDVSMIIGNKRYGSSKYVITNINSSRDKIRVDKNGNAIRREVSITLKSKTAIMRDDIDLTVKNK